MNILLISRLNLEKLSPGLEPDAFTANYEKWFTKALTFAQCRVLWLTKQPVTIRNINNFIQTKFYV